MGDELQSLYYLGVRLEFTNSNLASFQYFLCSGSSSKGQCERTSIRALTPAQGNAACTGSNCTTASPIDSNLLTQDAMFSKTSRILTSVPSLLVKRVHFFLSQWSCLSFMDWVIVRGLKRVFLSPLSVALSFLSRRRKASSHRPRRALQWGSESVCDRVVIWSG